ncbi:MAG: hypothetical protein A2Y41_04425 [Spirochaetes bacterium GWB1_36_13]|nr:MAG: hypothetical protein A2Y41_04425 [Spirochaetes bacterium GWB1_36_13]
MKDLCLIGIDYGEKKLGLAFKERKLMRPAPIGCFKNQGDLLGKIVRLAKEKKADRIVIGLPLKMDGQKTSMTLKVETFVHKLRQTLPEKIGIELTNEIFTTQEAVERLRGLGKNESFIEKNIDSYSAVLILERFIEKNQPKEDHKLLNEEQ